MFVLLLLLLLLLRRVTTIGVYGLNNLKTNWALSIYITRVDTILSKDN